MTTYQDVQQMIRDGRVDAARAAIEADDAQLTDAQCAELRAAADEAETLLEQVLEQGDATWTLTIHGEGEQPEIYRGTAAGAEQWADALIARGDYDLAAGEKVTVQYHLASTTGERLDSHVVVEG